MKLVIKANSPPPKKQFWHHPDANTRGEWSSIFACINSLFFSSHNFNQRDDLQIIIKDQILIEFRSKELRYLGPSLRSAASLLEKAYSLYIKSGTDEPKESTPGVFVQALPMNYSFPAPLYHIDYNSAPSPIPDEIGTLFTSAQTTSKPIYTPASNNSQAIIWIRQEMR